MTLVYAYKDSFVEWLESRDRLFLGHRWPPESSFPEKNKNHLPVRRWLDHEIERHTCLLRQKVVSGLVNEETFPRLRTVFRAVSTPVVILPVAWATELLILSSCAVFLVVARFVNGNNFTIMTSKEIGIRRRSNGAHTRRASWRKGTWQIIRWMTARRQNFHVINGDIRAYFCESANLKKMNRITINGARRKWNSQCKRKYQLKYFAAEKLEFEMFPSHSSFGGCPKFWFHACHWKTRLGRFPKYSHH